MNSEEKILLIEEIKRTKFFSGEKGTALNVKYEINKTSIWQIQWSVRFEHTITAKPAILTIGDLLNTNYSEILKLKNCGVGTINDVRERIIKYAITPEKENLHHENNRGRFVITEETIKQRKLEIEYPFLSYMGIDFNVALKYFDMSLVHFEFPKRFQDFIKAKSINSLKELFKINTSEKSMLPNLGRTSLNRVGDLINEKIMYLEAGGNLENANNLIYTVNTLLDNSDERTRDIVIARWGGNELSSLDDIGLIYNITRERVRQIILGFINRVKRSIRNETRKIKENLLNYLIRNVATIDSEFLKEFNYSLDYPMRVYLGILSELFKEAPFEGFMPKSFVSMINRNIKLIPSWRKIINFLDQITMEYQEITPHKLVTLMKSNNLNISQQLLCYKIILGQKKYSFFMGDKQYFLLRRGGIRDITYGILKLSAEPLEIDAIMSMIRKYFDIGSKYTSLTSVINNIKQDERIIQFDRYVFGITEHLTYSEKEWNNIGKISKNFLSSESRQCYVTEILGEVKNYYPLLKSKYELVYILRHEPEIRDLGFFNFILSSFDQDERIKVSELITDLFNKNPCIKHASDIKEKLKEKRYIHDMGISALLKSQKDLKGYLGGFYGLKSLDKENTLTLAGEERFIQYLVDRYFFPSTSTKTVTDFFSSEELKQKVISTVDNSNLFQSYTLENGVTCLLINNWNIVKKIKCLLANLNEEVYEEQLLWMLKDVGVNLNEYKRDLYKIKADQSIIFSNNKYSFVEMGIVSPELNFIIDDCYDLINDSIRSYNLQELFKLIDSEKNGIEYIQFVTALKEDERFIVLDNNLVLIK